MRSFASCFAVLSCGALGLVSSTAHADPGPQAYAEARAPLPEAQIDALTRKLEALATKTRWKEANTLATEQLGETWCSDEIALPFRTFAALGVVARRSRQADLALTCTLRSFFAADTRVQLGQVYFELSLLVDAMNVEQFMAFRERIYSFKTEGCDQDSGCCYYIKGYDSIIRSFDNAFYGEQPGDRAMTTDPKLIEAQQANSSTRLLEHAFYNNPSPTLARRLAKKVSDGTSNLAAMTLSTLPHRLPAVHTARSLKQAETWIRKSAEGRREDGSAIETETFDTRTKDGLQVTRVMAHVLQEGCSGPYYSVSHVVVHAKDSRAYHIFRDPVTYSANGCGGYGDDYAFEEVDFQAATEKGGAPLFVLGSSTSSYINGGACGATGASSERFVACSLDESKTPRCMLWSRSSSWDQELGDESQVPDSPSFRFRKGVSDFARRTYSSSMQSLVEPLDGVSFMKLYKGIPEVEKKVHGWFEVLEEKKRASEENAKP